MTVLLASGKGHIGGTGRSFYCLRLYIPCRVRQLGVPIQVLEAVHLPTTLSLAMMVGLTGTVLVRVPSEAGLEEEKEELEPRPYEWDGMSPQESLESPGAEDDAVPGPSGIGSISQPNGELPVLMKAGKDQLPTISSDERQQIPSKEEQLPLLPDPRNAESGVEERIEEVCEAACEEAVPALLTRNIWLGVI